MITTPPAQNNVNMSMGVGNSDHDYLASSGNSDPNASDMNNNNLFIGDNITTNNNNNKTMHSPYSEGYESMGTPEHLVQSSAATSTSAVDSGEIISTTTPNNNNNNNSIVADPLCMFLTEDFLAMDEDGLVDETGLDDLFTDMFSVGEYY